MSDDPRIVHVASELDVPLGPQAEYEGNLEYVIDVISAVDYALEQCGKTYAQGQRDEQEHVTDLLTAVVDRIPFQDRFTVFGLLYVQSEQLGWDEVMRRATIRPKLETS
jgi:hypothetical protein